MIMLPAIPEAPHTAQELLKHYPVLEMAKAFREGTAEIGRLMKEIQGQSQMMISAFCMEDQTSGWAFDVDFSYHGNRRRADDFAGIKEEMKRTAWRILMDKIGLRAIMSVKKRREFDEQLEKGELPDITEESIVDVIMGLCEQARDFAKEASLEVFGILRPRNGWGGEYKTNDAFRVGRRVILPHRVDRAYSGDKFHANYHNEQDLIAIDAVFHLLDGKGVMRENRGFLVKAISEAEGGKGETDYFHFKCFKNHNLHLEFKRLDLVQELNLLATGKRVLGNDMEAD